MKDDLDDGLRRSLGPFGATSVVVGAIVGVGIFFTPARVASLAGDPSLALLAWVAGGAIALLGALAFAELGGRVSRSGGQYEILRQAYGPAAAFVFVFTNATANQSGAIAIIALICADHVGLAFTGALPGPAARVGGAVLLILALAITNLVGVRAGAGVQNLTVVAKITTLVAIAAVGWFAGGHALPAPTGWTAAGFFSALVPVFFSFGGFQHALWIGGEVRDPTRTVPRAIVGGTLLVLVCYLLVNVAYFRLLGPSVAGARAVAAESVAAVWPSGARIVAGAVMVSALGVLNAQLLSGPRLIYAMARQGQFFSAFGRPIGRDVPGAAILLLAGLGVTLALVGTIEPLLNGVVLVNGIFMALTGIATLRLRRLHPMDTGLRVWAWVPIVFAIGELAVVGGAFLGDEKNGQSALITVLWVAVALAVHRIGFSRERTS